MAPGRTAPLGATVVDGGVNFSLFPRNASEVELLFFDREDDARLARVIVLDPENNRTYHYWHAFVPAVRPGESRDSHFLVRFLCLLLFLLLRPGRWF